MNSEVDRASMLTARRHEFDDPSALQEHVHSSGWTDGLPIVPPTPDAVAAQLDWAGLGPDLWSGSSQRYVFERARIHLREWTEVGKANAVADKGDREYAALTAPEDLLVLAAGGPAGGFGAVIPPWLGAKSRAVTVPIGACVDC